VENSPMLTSRGLGTVLGDLASMGFNARWGVLGASDIGANHQRDRIWIRAEQMGNPNNDGQIATKVCTSITQRSNPSETKQEQTCKSEGSSEQYAELAYSRNERLQRGKWIRDNKKENSRGLEGTHGSITKRSPTFGTEADWWNTEPNVGRVVDGVASRMDRLKAIGNGQVPLCAATAWRILSEP